jgi:hypothetical protein
MITSQQIHWIAGLLEGEGAFKTGNSPSIVIGMTDLDIIERFRSVTKTIDMKIMPGPTKTGWKPAYYTGIYGSLAIQWMMTIYPLMGIRRKAKIKDAIEKWKMQRNKTAKFSPIKAIALARNISMQEAKIIFDGLMGNTIQ